jgi:hypothetical protein
MRCGHNHHHRYSLQNGRNRAKARVSAVAAPRYSTHEKFLRLFGRAAQHVGSKEPRETVEAIMIAEFWLTLYYRGKFTWQRQRAAALAAARAVEARLETAARHAP